MHSGLFSEPLCRVGSAGDKCRAPPSSRSFRNIIPAADSFLSIIRTFESLETEPFRPSFEEKCSYPDEIERQS